MLHTFINLSQGRLWASGVSGLDDTISFVIIVSAVVVWAGWSRRGLIPICNHNHTKFRTIFTQIQRKKRADLQKSTSLSVIMIANWYKDKADLKESANTP